MLLSIADSKESQKVVHVVMSLLNGRMESLGSLTRVVESTGSLAGVELALVVSGLRLAAIDVQFLSMSTVAAYTFL